MTLFLTVTKDGHAERWNRNEAVDTADSRDAVSGMMYPIRSIPDQGVVSLQAGVDAR